MLRSVVLLRHADAGSKSTWTGNDAHRPLSPDGLAQAAQLVDALEDQRFDQIWTSPLVRCQHTVAALAAHRRTPVLSAPWLAPDTDPISIELGLSTLSGRVLLCTHGECVVPVLQALNDDGDIVDGLEKGHALALRLSSTGSITSRRRIEPRPRVA